MIAVTLGRIRQGGLRAALLVLGGLLAAASPAAAADFPLSDPAGTSRWAPVLRPAVARAAPDGKALMRLGTRTPEGTQNLVLTLSRRDVGGRLWIRVRLPMLPNNSTGWVPRERLGGYTEVRQHLVVDRARLRLTLLRGRRVVFRARIGVGQRRWPTPAGEFYVRSRLRGFSSPMYGPLAFGLSARSAVLTDWPGGGFIGIHGTNEPGLIPGRISHGCIRLRNADVLRLGRRLQVGAPVTIR